MAKELGRIVLINCLLLKKITTTNLPFICLFFYFRLLSVKIETSALRKVFFSKNSHIDACLLSFFLD